MALTLTLTLTTLGFEVARLAVPSNRAQQFLSVGNYYACQQNNAAGRLSKDLRYQRRGGAKQDDFTAVRGGGEQLINRAVDQGGGGDPGVVLTLP